MRAKRRAMVSSKMFLVVLCLVMRYSFCNAQGNCPDGTPSTVTCSNSQGRICPSDHNCVNGLCCPTCRRKLQDLPSVPLPGTLVPRCEPTGNYSSEQCQGSTGQCWCVSETGEEIPNSRVLPGDFRTRNCDQERLRFTGGLSGSLGGSFVEGDCPPAVGFGVCLNRCSTDTDCASEGRKCCSNGCGRQCMQPVINRPGGSLGGTFGGVGSSGLFETKSGSCPVNPSPGLSLPTTARDECTTDNSCSGLQKCCFTSSGYRCLNPVGDVGSDNKPGFCPPLPSGFSASNFRIDQCARDSECGGSFKCCETTSGRTCQLPTTQPQISPVESQSQCDTFSNEVFETCASPCPIACDNQDVPPSCPGQPCTQRCVCRLGYIRSSSRDPRSPCVPRSQCQSPGSFGGFIPTPNSFGNFSRPGLCPQGELQSQVAQSISNGQATVCTQDSQCPGDQKCCQTPASFSFSTSGGSLRCLCPDQNAVWKQCGSSCPETCNDPRAPGSCGSQCVQGCACADGYVKHSNSPNAPCVPRSQCSQSGFPGTNLGGFGPGPVIGGGFITGATQRAVAKLVGNGSLDGVITFTQVGSQVQVTGTVRGLTPGQHGFHIHTYGDMSSSCSSVGDHFNPDNRQHGGQQDRERHAGDLGNINADRTGTALVSIIDSQISLGGPYSILGRSVVVHEREDDLGRSGGLDSRRDGNSGFPVACGVIGIAP